MVAPMVPPTTIMKAVGAISASMCNPSMIAPPKEPYSALTGSVKDALRLGCSAIGYTIYPGSAQFQGMYDGFKDRASAVRSLLTRPEVGL